VGQYELCLACNLKKTTKEEAVEKAKAIVAEALAKPNSLNNSIKCVGDTAADPAVSHTLIQIESNPPYYEKVYKYGSVYIAEQVYQKHSHEAVQELKKFLNASDSQGPYAALRGNLFEGFAHTHNCEWVANSKCAISTIILRVCLLFNKQLKRISQNLNSRTNQHFIANQSLEIMQLLILGYAL